MSAAAPRPTVVCDACTRPAVVFLVYEVATGRHVCSACYRAEHPGQPGTLRGLLEELRTFLRDSLVVEHHEPATETYLRRLMERVDERLELPPAPAAAAALAPPAALMPHTPPQEKTA